MKKVLVVITMFFSFFLSSSSCSAAPDWYWLTSTDSRSYYVDRSCGIWDKMELHVSLKTVGTDGKYRLINLVAKYKNGPEIYLKNETVFAYDANGRYLFHYVDKEWQKVKSNTVGATIAIKLFELYEGHFERDNHIPE